MEALPSRVEVFVLRVWPPAKEELQSSAGELRGFIHHVGSARERPFDGPAELLASISEALATHVGRAARSGTEEK